MVGSHPDLCSELLARELEADVFIRATEADAVFVDWGKRQRRHLGKLAQRRHARVADDLLPNDTNGLLGMVQAKYGFEGITYNGAKQRFYLLVEARKHAKGAYKALIVECDHDFKYVKDRPVNFPFESGNKGFEAIVHLRRNSKDYLLALCEGNKCKRGAKGRKPGGGRVLLFEKKKKCWLHVGTIALPRSLPFVDYSGMSIDNSRVTIVSQVSSMLWVGNFNEADWTWRDKGQLYQFPRSKNGAIQYGNI